MATNHLHHQRVAEMKKASQVDMSRPYFPWWIIVVIVALLVGIILIGAIAMAKRRRIYANRL